MRTLLKSNDIVVLDYAQALLRDAQIPCLIFDDSMSVMDGSLGILPRRLVVADEDEAEARAVLDAGLGEGKLEP